MSIFGEAVYNGRLCVSGSIGENFILKSVDGELLYIFAFDIGIYGDENVVVDGKYKGSYAFGNVKDEIVCIEWMDNGEKLKFIQGEGILCVNFTGYQYGTSYVVRVAKAKIKK